MTNKQFAGLTLNILSVGMWIAGALTPPESQWPYFIIAALLILCGAWIGVKKDEE